MVFRGGPSVPGPLERPAIRLQGLLVFPERFGRDQLAAARDLGLDPAHEELRLRASRAEWLPLDLEVKRGGVREAHAAIGAPLDGADGDPGGAIDGDLERCRDRFFTGFVPPACLPDLILR